jgi:hypothetical protein
MNWLDTQTKEFLQKVGDEKLALAKTAEFALIMIRKGPDRKRLVDAISQINKCSESSAAILVEQPTPTIINRDLTEEEALWGQFELICCDTISLFLRSEVLEQNDKSYLWPLYKKISESPEFKPAKVNMTEVPDTESGDKFIEQFLGVSETKRVFPMQLTVPFKKARIMEHWATRVGARLKLDISEA